MLSFVFHELLFGVVFLFGQMAVGVEAQQAGEGFVYIKDDQHISGYVASMNSNPKPKKLVLGAWFKPDCANRVSIPSNTQQQMNRLSDSMEALFWSETQTDDGFKRAARCGWWVAVAYVFHFQCDGRYFDYF